MSMRSVVLTPKRPCGYGDDWQTPAKSGPSMLTSNRSWDLFAALVLLHVAGVLFAPSPLAPFIAGSVYLPLMPLQQMGVPVFGSGESGGWAAPSILGWAAVVAMWAVTWWAVAKFAFGLWRRFGPSRSGEGIYVGIQQNRCSSITSENARVRSLAAATTRWTNASGLE